MLISCCAATTWYPVLSHLSLFFLNLISTQMWYKLVFYAQELLYFSGYPAVCQWCSCATLQEIMSQNKSHTVWCRCWPSAFRCRRSKPGNSGPQWIYKAVISGAIMLGFGHTQSGGNPCNERGGSHFLSSSLSHLLSAMHRSADALMPSVVWPGLV